MGTMKLKKVVRHTIHLDKRKTVENRTSGHEEVRENEREGRKQQSGGEEGDWNRVFFFLLGLELHLVVVLLNLRDEGIKSLNVVDSGMVLHVQTRQERGSFSCVDNDEKVLINVKGRRTSGILKGDEEKGRETASQKTTQVQCEWAIKHMTFAYKW